MAKDKQQLMLKKMNTSFYSDGQDSEPILTKQNKMSYPVSSQISCEDSCTNFSRIDMSMQNYKTIPRTKLDFYSIKSYLKQKEIPCIKLNYCLDKEI